MKRTKRERTSYGGGWKKWWNGDIYEGQWKDDKRQGKGTMKLANDEIFKGSWKNGFYYGIGFLMAGSEIDIIRYDSKLEGARWNRDWTIAWRLDPFGNKGEDTSFRSFQDSQM